MRVSYSGSTSAFQAEDAGSIPATRSNLYSRSHINDIFFVRHLFPDALCEMEKRNDSQDEHGGIICKAENGENIGNNVQRHKAIENRTDDCCFCSEWSFAMKEESHCNLCLLFPRKFAHAVSIAKILYSMAVQKNTYNLLDFGHGKRLEQWGEYMLVRPDPTAAGEPLHPALWSKADAVYEGEKGKGTWRKNTELPEQWMIAVDDLHLRVRLAPYKHTGVFPEQVENWRWARARGSAGKPLTVLNLFAYTGGMTMALAKDGHAVTHVDASKPAIVWAKENAELNQLSPTSVRWIMDDVPTFVAREKKRGKQYDGIILDPPAYGHSPSGKTWRVERDLAPILEDCIAILSSQPAFLILNGYAQADTPDSFRRLLTGIIKTKNPRQKFDLETKEMNLETEDGRKLSTGIVARVAFR